MVFVSNRAFGLCPLTMMYASRAWFSLPEASI